MVTLWSRDRVAAKILSGEHLIVYHDNLLRIPPSWLDAHPGGRLALLHFVGRDATDEIEAYHPRDTLSLVSRFSIGRLQLIDGTWKPLIPPIMSGWVRIPAPDRWFNEAQAHRSSSQILLVKQHNQSPPVAPDLATLEPPPTSLSLHDQAQHSRAYKELHTRIVDAGLYETPYLTGYGPEVLRYALLASLSAYTYSHNWLITSAVFLGLMWHQLVFTAHDLGHMGVTHNWVIDRLLGILIADFIGGLSIGWWVENHNVHHRAGHQSPLPVRVSSLPNASNRPNSLNRASDPDIEHLPFFAISPAFFSSLWSSYYKRTMHFDRFAAFFISLQHKLFYIVMAFARFNLYANSYTFLFRKAWDTKRARGGRWAWVLEIVGLAFFWCWYGNILYGCGTWRKALAYLMVSHVVTSPLHVQIVLSHFSMSTADLGPTESFPHRQMRTTSDVLCSPSVAFIHGGLHLQVTHHLFPRLPRHNLKRASVLVKEFAQEQGLVYAEFGFVDGNAEVIGVLKGVADQVRLLAQIANVEAKEAVDKKLAKKKS